MAAGAGGCEERFSKSAGTREAIQKNAPRLATGAAQGRNDSPRGLMKSVASAAKTRRERPRKRNVWGVHEHFEVFRNAGSAVVFQQTHGVVRQRGDAMVIEAW